jgi:cytochrome c oxidase assembly protein subunit 11
VTPRRTALLIAVVPLAMAGLSFAAVPFYRWFCQVTGFAGTPSVAAAASDTILERTVTVRFDANTDPALPWRFAPMQRAMTVRIGETGLAFYEATNLADRPVAGSATFNVTPDAAGGHFSKIACFCFTEQVLQPGETVQMPVSFFVDPAIMADPEGRVVNTITLSYTFFETELPETSAGLAPPAPAPVN